MHQTLVTCHECFEQHVLHAIEWPPKIFICSGCGSIFQFESLSILEVPTWKFIGYCRDNS